MNLQRKEIEHKERHRYATVPKQDSLQHMLNISPMAQIRELCDIVVWIGKQSNTAQLILILEVTNGCFQLVQQPN
jgi:hypothetical protein